MAPQPLPALAGGETARRAGPAARAAEAGARLADAAPIGRGRTNGNEGSAGRRGQRGRRRGGECAAVLWCAGRAHRTGALRGVQPGGAADRVGQQRQDNAHLEHGERELRAYDGGAHRPGYVGRIQPRGPEDRVGER